MACNDGAVFCYQHRNGKAKALNRPRNLGHLVIWVQSGILSIGHKVFDRPHLNACRRPCGLLGGSLVCHGISLGFGETKQVLQGHFVSRHAKLLIYLHTDAPKRNALTGDHFANSTPKSLILRVSHAELTKRNGFFDFKKTRIHRAAAHRTITGYQKGPEGWGYPLCLLGLS